MPGIALSALLAADARVEHHCRERTAGLPSQRLTLNPLRCEATSLVELHHALTPRLASPVVGEVLGRGLIGIVDAILEHFPDNLLWDLDGMVASLTARCSEAADLERAFDDIVGLIALYGRRTAIRFRYMHDFTYGFDWAKWVRRDPEGRAGVGPFDAQLLAALLARGHELLALIEADDSKYAQLTDSKARNPFGFSREPADEILLYRALVHEGIVPMQTWELDSTPTWDRPYADLRAAHAARARLAEQ